MSAPTMPDTRRCPLCRTWIPMGIRHQRQTLNAHIKACRDFADEKRRDDASDAGRWEAYTAPETVKRITLDGAVIDTYQTEGELNGWKPKQGALL